MPKAQAAPQLLILAEPLLREGLQRLLDQPEAGEPALRVATDPSELESGVQLVIWSVAGSMPAGNLLQELQQLKERWQPAPLLLLLPGDAPYASDWLLQLPAEGLLQQAEPQEIRHAVATLLSGGRVVELRPLHAMASAPDPTPLGFGQWLLQSGLAQIEAERRRCRRWLEICDGGLSRLLLQGRLRELAMARRLLLWLWGPISLAFPAEPQPAGDTAPSGTGNRTSLTSTAITLRERTAIAVWETIQGRLVAAAQAGLRNSSGQLLALEGLTEDHRRDLLLALISQLDLLIIRLRLDQLRGEELEQRWPETISRQSMCARCAPRRRR